MYRLQIKKNGIWTYEGSKSWNLDELKHTANMYHKLYDFSVRIIDSYDDIAFLLENKKDIAEKRWKK